MVKKKRVRPHITVQEAFCRCGCGLIQSDKTLDWVNMYIELCGFSIPISTLARCRNYNRKVGGVDDSPHQLIEVPGEGAGDFKARNPHKRMKMIDAAMALAHLGFINQVECADRHIHLAKLPDDHRLAGCFNWGKSR